ncbi:hypothetical protein BZL54_32925 [Burkholderia ubonensis subsp. mesacidophila]|uniref:Uncharacterized protein n=1 Tax=Burkholderia ubonensis subsp. mesacidophila TaxID=265293 RepID=A0A2A4EVB7_9BURK|nr:hypothetical protein BZL54_32925 [Burkholderia ubonensis subsp. mesacidophila]
MKKIATVLFTAMMLASSYASAESICKAGRIDKIESDPSGNLLVSIVDNTYVFNQKEFFSIIYSVFNSNRNFIIYGNGCVNGMVATRFAVR